MILIELLAGPHQPLGCHKPTCLTKKYMYVCMYVNVCMYVCMYVCMFIVLLLFYAL